MKIIDAICCVYPDGTVFWTDDVRNGPSRAADAWRSTLSDERKTELMDENITLGAVMIRMRAEDYYSIKATNGPMTLAYMTNLLEQHANEFASSGDEG
jgi:hypothetical protein